MLHPNAASEPPTSAIATWLPKPLSWVWLKPGHQLREPDKEQEEGLAVLGSNLLSSTVTSHLSLSFLI